VYMAKILSSESDAMRALPITARKFVKLRRARLIPFLKIDRYTRVYDIERVVEALQRLETSGKMNTAVSAVPIKKNAKKVKGGAS
jgi:hypothetical protein